MKLIRPLFVLFLETFDFIFITLVFRYFLVQFFLNCCLRFSLLTSEVDTMTSVVIWTLFPHSAMYN